MTSSSEYCGPNGIPAQTIGQRSDLQHPLTSSRTTALSQAGTFAVDAAWCITCRDSGSSGGQHRYVRLVLRCVLGFAISLVSLSSGCGGGASAPAATRTTPTVRPGVPPPSDEAGFRNALAAEVTSGGLYFADPACQTQFGRSGTIAPDSFDAFARCVSTLHLRPTGRAHWLDDASVLTDDAGFELEALVIDGRLAHIGFAGRAPGMPDLPTITPEALEALRTGGDPEATISDFDAKTITAPGSATTARTEHLRICMNDKGVVTTVLPGSAMTPDSTAAFSALTRGWTFRPFVVGSTAIAVCAIVPFEYPATAAGPPRRLPRPPEISKTGRVVFNVRPAELEPLRLTGTKLVVPDDVDKVELHGKRLVGSFKLCLGEDGRYEQGTLLKSTGVPGYDAKIASAMMAWTYRPYLVDGVPVPVCTAVTFIYTQR